MSSNKVATVLAILMMIIGVFYLTSPREVNKETMDKVERALIVDTYSDNVIESITYLCRRLELQMG